MIVPGMTKFEAWWLRRLAKRQVTQGGHEERIIAMYRIIADAAHTEFYEDPPQVLTHFLQECNDSAIKQSRTEVKKSITYTYGP